MMQIVFSLPYALVLPNRRGVAHTRRAQAAKIHAEREKMAWEIAIAMAGTRPFVPLKYVRVQVFRHSKGVPDTDNLYSACKPLLDVLQPSKKNRSYGLGIIENDAATRCQLRALDAPLLKRELPFTRVIITEIDATAIAAARRASLEQAERAAA
ncbi:MAG: hypothetical protein KGL63_06000 [Betaproteobacteria bacterium]|nr:hypothetical protein [Betaproteobacteria bacterium]